MDRPSLRRLLARPGTLVVLALGLVLRAWLVASPVGVLNADEAVTGLMARQISEGTPRLIMAGAAYTAPVESWLYAPIYAISGPHILGLKLLSVLLWAAAAVLMVGAARRVLSDRGALLAGAALWVAPGALASLSVRAYVGYASGLCVLAGLLWSAFVSAEQSETGDRNPTFARSAVTGGLAGLVFYVHPMFVAVAAPVGLAVGVAHLRHVRRWWLPALGAAIAVNVPFMLWNAANDWDSLHPVDPANPGTPWSRFWNFFRGLIPRMVGMRTDSGRWLLGTALGVVVTVALAAVVVAGAIALASRCRAGWVVAAPLLLAWPLMSSFGAMSFVADGRYGVITLPFALVAGVGAVERWVLDRRRLPAPVVPGLAAAVWLAVVVVPFGLDVAGTDPVRPNAPLATLMHRIEDSGVTQVTGSYWVMQQVDYLSEGRFAGPLVPGSIERFPDSQRFHDETTPDRLGIVFLASDEARDYLVPEVTYRREQYGEYVFYVPQGAPG